MSDTPETDAAWQAPCDDNEDHTIILVDTCRRLERERDEWQERHCQVSGDLDDARGRELEYGRENADLRAAALLADQRGARLIDDLRAENQRLAKILSDLEAIRELDC